MEAINNPEDESAGTRLLPFSGELYIEHDDFMEDPPKKFFRLGPGREVRLRYGYWIRCVEVVKDDAGEVVAGVDRVGAVEGGECGRRGCVAACGHHGRARPGAPVD